MASVWAMGLLFAWRPRDACAGSSTFIHDQSLNYACPLVYTTSLDNAAIVAALYFFDFHEDSTAEKSLRRQLSSTRHTSRSTSVLSSLRPLSPRNPIPASLPPTSAMTTRWCNCQR